MFLVQSGLSQVTQVNYQMRYNDATCRWDCYIIVEEGSATLAGDRIQYNSQYSIVVPANTNVAVAQNFMPLNSNQNYTGTVPLKWAVASNINKPAVTPNLSYFGITPNLSPSSFYNNINEGDTIKLFSITVTPNLYCGDSLWIFRNGIDPDSGAPGMAGGDFSNGFAIGTSDQIYNTNLPTVYPKKPILNAVTACAAGVEIDLTATTSTCQSPMTYEWSGPAGYTGTTQDVAINPATEANAGIYKVVVTDKIGCKDSLEIDAPVKPNAGTDQIACAAASAILTGTGPATGTWTADGNNPSGAVIGSSTDGIATVDFTSIASGFYKFIYTVGPCSDTMQVEVIMPDAGPDPDAVGCFQSGTTSMSAVGAGTWTLSNLSDGTANIADPSNPNTTVSGFSAPGTYYLVWTINGCTDIAEIIVGENCACLIMGNSLAAVTPTTYCGTSGVITLDGGSVTPAGGTYTWEYSLNNAPFAAASGTNSTEDYQTPNLSTGNHRYRRVYFLNEDPPCYDTSNVVQFVVNPTPAVPGLSASPNPNCLGTVVSLTATGAVGATYTWTASSVNAGLVNTMANTATINPTVIGTYTITVTQTVTGCTSNPVTLTTMTDPVPLTPSASTVTGHNPTACNTNTGTITFSGMEPNVSYQLDYARNNIAQAAFVAADENGLLTLSGLSAGTYTNFKFTNALDCASGVYAGPVVLIDPTTPEAPLDIAADPNPTCANTMIRLTVAKTPGAIYTWTASSPMAGLIPSMDSTTIMVPTASGFYSIDVTQTISGCTSPPANIGISVNASPPTPTSTTVTSVNPTGCGLATGSIRISGLLNVTSYTITYNYNGNPMTANVTTNGSGIATIPNLASGSYTSFRVTDITSCSSGTYAGPVNLTDPSTPAAPTNLTAVPNPVCLGTSVALSVTNTVGATYTWTATPAAGAGLGTGTTATTTMLPTVVGTYTINVTQTIAGCTSLPATTTVTVNPTPPTPTAGTVSAVNPAVCSASTGSISFAGLLNNTAYTISYTRNTVAATANVTTNGSGIATITGLNAATYAAFRITNAVGCASGTYAGPVVLTDPLAPSAPANLTANPNPVCPGNVVALSVTPNAGATYAWTATPVGSGLIASTSNSTTMSTLTSGTYTISVTQTVAGCTSPVSSVTVVVSTAPPTPTAGSVSSTNPSVCAGSDATISFSGLLATTPYTINYSRNNVLQSASVTTDASGIAVITGLDAGNYSGFSIANANGCSSGVYNGTVGLSDPGSPAAPANLTANPNPVCIGTMVNLSVTNNTGSVYTWSATSGDAGLVTSSTNSTTMLATSPGSYTISVVQNIAGCTSPAANVVVIVNPIPPALLASNILDTDPTTCGGNQGSLILSGLPANTTYNVNYSRNGSATTATIMTNASGSATIPNLTAGSYTNFSLSATGGCTGGVYAGPVELTDPLIPSAPIGMTANPNPVCLGETVNLSVNNNTGATYTWSASAANAGLVSASINSTSMIAIAAGTYTISVTQTVTGCISNAATVQVVINPLPSTPTAGNVSSVNPTTCLGTDGSISISGYVANSTYTVDYTKDSAPLSASLLSNGFGIITINNLSAGVYSNFRITNTQGCSSGLYNGQVTLTDPPSQGTPIDLVANPDPSCLGELVNLSVTNESGATYTWSVSSSATAGLSNSTTNTTTMLATAPAIYTVSVTKTVAGCVSSPATVSVTVNPAPRTPGDNNFSVVNPTCGDSNGSVTISGLVPNESHTITFLYNGNSETTTITANGNGMATLSGYAAGIFTNFTVTNVDGCSSGVYPGPVELTDPGLPTPPTGFVSDPPQICIKSEVALSVDNNPGAVYNWSAPDPGAGLQQSTSNTTTMQPQFSGFYVISVTQTINGCTSLPATIEVEVKADCYNPDFDVTFVDVPLDGNVSTNDNPDATKNYGTAEPQAGNPSGCLPVIASDGSYTFVCGTIGKYTYLVPVCSGDENTCVNVTLVITVLEAMSVNNPPVANPDYSRTKANIPVTIKVLANDKCQSASNCTLTNLSVNIFPLHGTYNTSTGIYTPANDFIGQDSFRYSVCQEPLVSMNNCSDAWVFVTILAENVSNITNAMDDYAQTPLNTVLNVNATNGLLANDTDPEGNLQAVTPFNTNIPGKGTFNVQSNGAYTFTPETGFVGPVYTPYEVCDDEDEGSACDQATLHILVEPSVPRATVGNRVWHDQNGDGLQNSNELGILNVTVRLFTASGTLVGTAITNSAGEYQIESVAPGTYYMQFVAPDGYEYTFAKRGAETSDSDVITGKVPGGTALFTIAAGETNLNYDAGLYQCSRIGDRVWYDINRNDVWDSNENGINEIEVYLWRNHFGIWLVWDYTRTGTKPNSPSDDGHYEFCAPPGQYYVEVRMPQFGLVQALANKGNNRMIDSDLNNSSGIGTTSSFSLSSGQHKLDLGAGFYPMATAGNLVWIDVNQNGVQDANEPSAAGVSIEALDAETHEVVGNSLTDSDGVYKIEYLQKKDIYFRFDVPAGYSATVPNATADNMDSDVDHTYGPNTTRKIKMQSGVENQNIDLGIMFGVLPVDWLYINAKRKDKVHHITWATQKEVNVSHYQLERKLSKDGNFEAIGEKISLAASNSQIQQYETLDYDTDLPGIYYYRVKQVDFDGKYTYSDVVYVSFTGDSEITLYPSPAVNESNLDLNLEIASKVEIQLFDASSRLIQKVVNKELEEGSHTFKLDLNGLNAGVYNVLVTINGQNITKKLIKIE
jgi:hypothetical protein